MGYQPTEKKKQEKNPKQILIDWVKGVRGSAEKAKKYNSYACSIAGQGTREHLDKVSDCISDILGQCKAMEVVLNNSD